MAEARSQRPEIGNRQPEVARQVVEASCASRPAIRHFTDLIAWQKAFDLGCLVFAASKRWPSDEKYALTDQVRRSSRSVAANISEAWGKRRYQAHFLSKLSDADAELLETETWLLFALDHQYLAATDFEKVRELIREIGRILGGIMANPGPFLLRDSLRNSP